MTATPTATRAPDFPTRTGKPSTYPSGGERIGPAWQWIWGITANNPVPFNEIAHHCQTEWGLAERTVLNILSMARRHGLVAVSGEARWAERTVHRVEAAA